MILTDLQFEAPLDHAHPDGEKLPTLRPRRRGRGLRNPTPSYLLAWISLTTSWNGVTWKSMRSPIASMFFFHSVWISREIAARAQRQRQRQRLAVGRAAEAVGVALAVAEAIEQRVAAAGS